MMLCLLTHFQLILTVWKLNWIVEDFFFSRRGEDETGPQKEMGLEEEEEEGMG